MILLDSGLPGIDGFTTCQKIRESLRIPIIMVTAEDRDEDKVRGLKIGTDDYVTKPFSTTELAARVKAVLRRYDMTNAPFDAGPSSAPTTKPDSPDTPQDTATPAAPAAPSAPDEPESDADIYEGTFNLEVQTTGSIRGMIQFVDELRQSEEFHLSRLVADQNKEAAITWPSAVVRVMDMFQVSTANGEIGSFEAWVGTNSGLINRPIVDR